MAEAVPYYRPELDALRFFAFLCVFAFHRMDYVPLAPGWGLALSTVGAFGVPMFFLLSAFLITELLRREHLATGQVHVRAFYLRRILRIWPLYFAAFFGLALLDRVLPGVGSRDPRAWAAFTFFLGNWYITFHGWIAGATDPLWSISVEEQFYIAIPLLLRFGGPRALRFTSGALLFAAFATVTLYARHRTGTDQGEWTDSFVQFQFFAAGVLLALGLHGRVPSLIIVFRLAGVALGVGCWLAALLFCRVESWNPQAMPGQAVVGWGLVLGGTALLFICVLGTPAQWVPRPLAYLGRISYGLYVVHSLVLLVVFKSGLLPRPGVETVLALALSIALAHLSFRYFEQPFLRLKRRFTVVPAREEARAVGSS